MITYPQSPGFKGEAETSSQAATAAKPNADQLRKEVLAALAKESLTADECAARIRPPSMNDVSFQNFKRSVRSRCSELKAQGKVEDSQLRRKNESGSNAVVLRIKKTETKVLVSTQPQTTTTATQAMLL